jgi:hypothetical protein
VSDVNLSQSVPKIPVAVMAASVPLFLLATDFIWTGVQFALWPEALKDLGYVQTPSLTRRVLGLAMSGAVGAGLILVGIGLLRLRSRSRQLAIGLAMAVGLLFVKRIAIDGSRAPLEAVGLVGAVTMVVFLELRAVRVAFQTAERHRHLPAA